MSQTTAPPQYDELPAYVAGSAAPDYNHNQLERRESTHTAVVTLRLRQANRTTQEFVPFGGTDRTTYEIKNKSFASLSRSRPDIVVDRLDGHSARRAPIARARFARSGPVPWVPRATISYFLTSEECLEHLELDRSRGNGWVLHIDGQRLRWCLNRHPIRLVLIVDGDESQSLQMQPQVDCVATFIFSRQGTNASDGRPVGHLSVFQQRIASSKRKIEQILCSCALVIMHWKNEGKVLFNVGDDT